MAKIAITGNIAAGKSIVENILREKGYKVYDADKIAHEILANSPQVRQAFCEFDILNDGEISREKLGKLVFNNKELRQRLENIIHPQIKQFIEELNDELVFVAVPLLFEAQLEGLFDKIIFISAPERLRLKRLMARNNLTEKEALVRINAQEPEDEKIKKSDFVIKNKHTISNITEKIEDILHKIKIKSPEI